MHEPTLLHVSRGISGTRPLRINCPPELAQLVLRFSSGVFLVGFYFSDRKRIRQLSKWQRLSAGSKS